MDSLTHFFIKTNKCNIIIFNDVDIVLTNDFIIDYINTLIKNPILTQNDIIHNINDYYKIIHVNFDEFDASISKLLNSDFKNNCNWELLFLIDKSLQKSRVYLKIKHGITDGYKLIDLLTSPFKSNYTLPKFKRNSGIYHCIFGTIILMYLYFIYSINTFKQIIFDKPNPTQTKIDFIQCESFNLNKIKLFVKKHNITINDFLYSLMIKSDKLYFEIDKKLSIFSPINISGLNHINNSCPIFININNSLTNETLLKKINNLFNHFKYSCFIPIYNNILAFFSYLNIDMYIYFTDFYLNHINYAFTNIIGPPIQQSNDILIKNMHFIVEPYNSEIVYNVVSCGDNINIICSFREGIISNKLKFKQCIHDAFNDLMQT